jgi:hypothetical protein
MDESCGHLNGAIGLVAIRQDGYAHLTEAKPTHVDDAEFSL